MILVDTSVWVDYLRDRATPQVHLLRKLLQQTVIYTTPVVLQELLAGARDTESLEQLREHFSGLPVLSCSTSTYLRAGELYARCRWEGITPRSPHDCLIASVCIENHAELLHDDADFRRIASVDARLTLI